MEINRCGRAAIDVDVLTNAFSHMISNISSHPSAVFELEIPDELPEGSEERNVNVKRVSPLELSARSPSHEFPFRRSILRCLACEHGQWNSLILCIIVRTNRRFLSTPLTKGLGHSPSYTWSSYLLNRFLA